MTFREFLALEDGSGNNYNFAGSSDFYYSPTAYDQRYTPTTYPDFAKGVARGLATQTLQGFGNAADAAQEKMGLHGTLPQLYQPPWKQFSQEIDPTTNTRVLPINHELFTKIQNGNYIDYHSFLIFAVDVPKTVLDGMNEPTQGGIINYARNNLMPKFPKMKELENKHIASHIQAKQYGGRTVMQADGSMRILFRLPKAEND
jgi:hypothetical protein